MLQEGHSTHIHTQECMDFLCFFLLEKLCWKDWLYLQESRPTSESQGKWFFSSGPGIHRSFLVGSELEAPGSFPTDYEVKSSDGRRISHRLRALRRETDLTAADSLGCGGLCFISLFLHHWQHPFIFFLSFFFWGGQYWAFTLSYISNISGI